MRNLITTRDVAALANRSTSQINRDASSGRLTVADTFPGYRGGRLFDPATVERYIADLRGESK
jgi:hypothetical protein